MLNDDYLYILKKYKFNNNLTICYRRNHYLIYNIHINIHHFTIYNNIIIELPLYNKILCSSDNNYKYLYYTPLITIYLKLNYSNYSIHKIEFVKL